MNFIKSNLIALLALVISFCSLLISFSNLLKSRVRLKIAYDDTETFCFGFMWYEKYKILISKISVENKSNTTVSISKITLTDNEKTYVANKFSLSDHFNENGLSLFSTTETNKYFKLNLKSENILNNTRIESNGILSGYAVFYNVDLISKPKEYRITVHTPTKKFSHNILAKPLAPNYKVENECKD